MKIDFHVHSKFSRDSVSEPSRLVKMAVRRGLDGIAIADHEAFGAAWQAKKAAEKISPGFLVIAGQEARSELGDVLCLFLESQVESRLFDEIVDEVHFQRGLVALPHMFDRTRRSSINVGKLSAGRIRSVDAVEAFNSRCLKDEYNVAAAEFAVRHKKPVIAGSDAHFGFELGTAFTVVEGPAEQDVKHNILAGRTKIFGKHSWLRPLIAMGLTKATKKVKKLFF